MLLDTETILSFIIILIEPIRTTIKSLARNFYDNLSLVPNELLASIPDYDVRVYYRYPGCFLIPDGIKEYYAGVSISFFIRV